MYTPNREVRMLPDTADSIFCGSDTSPRPAFCSASSALCVAVAMFALLQERGYITSNKGGVYGNYRKGAKRAAGASSWWLGVVTMMASGIELPKK